MPCGGASCLRVAIIALVVVVTVLILTWMLHLSVDPTHILKPSFQEKGDADQRNATLRILNLQSHPLKGKNNVKRPVFSASSSSYESFGRPLYPSSCADMPMRFVMALSYYDQQTSALWRLRSMQCWAREVGNYGVVEPAVVRSSLMAKLDAPSHVFTALGMSHPQIMPLKDVYNMAYLRNHTPSEKFGPLVDWECIQCSNKKWEVVLVHLVYNDVSEHYNVSYQSLLFHDDSLNFLKNVSVVVRRETTISFKKEGIVTLKRFSELILGNLTYTDNVIVIFNQWRGLVKGYFHYVNVNNSKCELADFMRVVTRIPLSSRVKRDAQLYHERFLGNKSFITLMIRAEIGINVKRCNKSRDFLERIFSTWKTMTFDNKLNQTFMSIDIGRFGTRTLSIQSRCNTTSYVKDLFRRVFGDALTFSQWEQSFVEVSGTTHAGYIAVLQKAVAVRAKCIVLAGGGNFQNHANSLFLSRQFQLHNLKPDQTCREGII